MNQVRPASPDELSLLPQIELSADTLFEKAGMHNLPPPASVEELRTSSHIFVIGKPIKGFARLKDIEGHAHLEQLSVDAEYTGQGLGGELLEETCSRAKQLGYSVVTLITFKEIRWNAPFYAKHRFSEVTDVPDYLQPVLDHEKQLGLDAMGQRVVMERKLD